MSFVLCKGIEEATNFFRIFIRFTFFKLVKHFSNCNS